MLDYPGHLACIVWIAGCSMRCSYCYNPEIVLTGSSKLSEGDLSEFLAERQGRLDGVVFSGGECTALLELPQLCRTVKELGFKVKIDTNGNHPAAVQYLLNNRLVDYIALDYKAPRAKFKALTGTGNFDNFSKTLDLLIESPLDFEVRTTFHSALLDLDDIAEIAFDLKQRGYNGSLYIQNFINGSKTLGDPGESRNLQSGDLHNFALKTVLRQ
jgi:pyruvate formate lyase activating enzyme